MTYREQAIEVVKIACQDVLDRVDALVPDTERVRDIDILIHIPTLTDDVLVIPNVTVTCDTYVNRVAEDKIFDIITRKD